MKVIILLFALQTLLAVSLIKCNHMRRTYMIDKMEDEAPGDGNEGDGNGDSDEGHTNALELLTPDEMSRLSGVAQQPQPDFFGSLIGGIGSMLCKPLCDRYKACRLSCLLHPELFSCGSCEFDPTRLIPCNCQIRFCKDMSTGKLSVDGCQKGVFIPITFSNKTKPVTTVN